MFHKTIAVIAVIGGAFMAYSISQPYLAEFEAAQKECGATKAETRTPEQKARCRPVRPMGFIVPGVF